MKKFFSLIAVAILTILCVQATPISQQEAATVCHHFLLQKNVNGFTQSTDFQYYKTEFYQGTAYCHIFKCNPVGFVVISASDHFDPIICYSFESDYQPNAAFDFAMDKYAKMVTYCEKNDHDFTAEVPARWQRYLDSNFSAEPMRGIPVVGPLVLSKWNQDMYFNTYCPWDIHASYGCDGRVYTGCVSTAMGQVMNYHGHPYSGLLGSSYIAGPYGRYTVKFFEQTYNYNAMPNRPVSYANEMAKLIHHCGVAVQMGYTTQGSGAQSVSAADAMKRHFKYDSATINYRAAYDTSISYWHNALKSELNLRRPLYYAANDGQGGHAFVVDGYDEDDKFHVNWGWGGSSDGYFTISDNNPYDMCGYIYDAEIIRFAYPMTDAPGVITGTNRLDASCGTFYSNMPTIDYAPNMDTRWLLSAPDANKYVLHFDRFNTEQDADIVTIYNGGTVESGVYASFCGSTIPGDVTINADEVLVTFTTDGQNQYPGFQVSYNATTAAPYCNDVTITTPGPTTITDGSGDAHYRNNTVCNWNINVPNMSRCYFSFPQIELGSGDFIEIYDKTTTPATLLERIDNQNFPSQDVLSYSKGKMAVRFVADNWDVNNGFTMTIESVTGVNDYAGVNELNVYPNPVSDVLNVNFVTADAENIGIAIVDMNGKIVEKRNYQHLGGLFKESLNVSELADGIYFLRIQTAQGTTMEKFIRQ